MSKIGKKPIIIPEGVSIIQGDAVLQVKGKNATLSVLVPSGVDVALKERVVTLTASGSKQNISNWGTLRANLQNAVLGSQKDFLKELSIIGIGFKAAIDGKGLVLNLGFSHPVKFAIPEGIKVTVDKSLISVSGPSKWLVGETAAKIRDLRKPEPYQGKGIRYKDEVVRKKAGKKAAAAAGPAASK